MVQWQFDVAMSLWRLAEIGVTSRAHLQEMILILEPLDRAGVLTEEQRRWLPMAKDRLANAR